MANRILPALLCALATAAAATTASAAELVPALTGLSASPSYACVGNLKPGNAFTLEAWVYPTGFRDYSGREKHGLNFMYKGRIGSHIDFVFALQENGILCIGNTYGYLGVMNKRVPGSKWTHVAVTLNNNTGDIRFYINGAYVGQGSGWQGRNPGRKGFVYYSGEELDIGGFNQRGWGYNNDNFKGSMADVRIWNVVRTPQQIADNYKKQLSGKEPGLMAYWTFADAKDKTGHGWNLKLGGDAKCTARKGPSLEPAAGISATMKAVSPFSYDIGQDVAFSASGASTTGTIAAATFKIVALDGKLAKSIPAETLENQGTNFTASASWAPTRSGIYYAQVAVTNAKLKSSFTSKSVFFAVRGPFLGAPAAIPGTIQAENFNVGADGTEYHDTTAKNTSACYRPNERADIAKTASGYVLTNAVAGEWLRYDVKTPAARATAGTVASNLFLLSARLSAKGTGGSFSVKPDGANDPAWPATAVSVPDTGGWTTFKTVQKAVWLPSSFSALRLNMVKNGSAGQVACFDWISLQNFVFNLPSTARTLPKTAAKGKEFPVTANAAWTAKTSASWITLRTKSGSGNGKVVYDVSANTEADRVGRIVVTCAGVSKTYTVTQRGTGPATLTLPAKSRTFPAGAAKSKEFAVKANFTWTAKSDVAWIKLQVKSAKGSAKVVYDVSANSGSGSRIGHVTVSGSGKSVTYTVTQQGVGPARLALSATSRTFSKAAATWKQVSVSANVGWTVTTDAKWITLLTKSGKNNGSVSYDIAANKGKQRVGHIYVKGSGKSATFTITQAGATKAAKDLRKGGASYPFVEASDGSDASAILDGDFDTVWSPADEEGCALVLFLDEPAFGEDVCIWGDLPDETLVYGDTEDGDWILIDDDDPDASYTRIRIDIPATYGLPSIAEVTLAPLADE